MWQVRVSTVLLLLAPIKGLNYTDDVQAEISRGESALNAIVDRTVLLDIQHALQQTRLAQKTALDVDRFHEMSTLSKLLEPHFAEIRRLVSAVRGLNAETCTLSTTAQANRIVTNSVAVYDGCVRKYMPELAKTIHNLTVTEYAYRSVYGEHGPSAIRQCAIHTDISAVASCVDKFVADFANLSLTVEQYLHSMAGKIAQALHVFPTCIETSRSNATTAINSLIRSIQVCAEGSGVYLTIKEFSNHTNNLSASVDLAVSIFSKDKEHIYQIQLLLASMINAFKHLVQQTKQITMTNAFKTVEMLFPTEASVIKNATATTRLPPRQFVCIKHAGYNYNSVIRRAARAWVECADNLSSQISQQLLSLEELNRKFERHVETDGFPAYMKCVTQHSANSSAAGECISIHSDKFLTYLNQVTEQADANYHVGSELADSLDQCLPSTQKNAKTEMEKIINNLKACVPQLGINYNSSP